MSNSIQTNVDSIIAQNNLEVNNAFKSQTVLRLTSGYRINSSSDDAAGLAVANKFRSDIAELTQGVRNANDGISVLQIVDGGLNNISTMLDRLKTLATESATDTFSGSRGTLNTEYQTLKTEIDRQAQNIGLSSTAGTGSRYSKDISVYIGGSAGSQSNASVTVAMSGARVDSEGLGLSNTNILGGAATVLPSGSLTAGTTFLIASTQDIVVSTAGHSYTAKLTGGTSGISGADVIAQLNNQLSSSGVTAGIDSTGQLAFYGGDKAFTVAANAVSGSGTTVATTTTADVMNDGLNSVLMTLPGTTTTATESLTFSVDNKTVSVDVFSLTADQVVDKVNSALSAYGITALQDSTGKVQFESSSTFSVAAASTSTIAAGNVASTTISDTANANAAISSLTAAVSTLGLVQGKVGTGQNQLQYAVDLANSQISSFSAAASRIRDADVASEASNLTKAQVLQQSSIAALAQANQEPQALLSLLKG